MSSAPFEQLLAALDTDRERAGTHYRELHRHLTKYFEWQCSREPDGQADAVIDRLGKKLADGERIVDLDAYAYGVAKRLVLEERKHAAREQRAHEHLLRVVRYAADDDAPDAVRQECFDAGLQALSPAHRDIILTYYTADGRAKIEARRALAERLGIDLNALRVRAHRIRAALEQRVWECVQQREGRR